MGRSSRAEALNNRAKILDHAHRLFRARGVDRVSIADVMGAAGMTTGGFYKHFASKHALVREVLGLAFAQASSRWRRRDRRARVAWIVRRYFEDRPRSQTCPMLAFAPHVASSGADRASKDAYARGAEELYREFAGSLDGEAGSERELKVLFAAMVGAQLLASATGNSAWARSVQDAVTRAARR